MENQAINKQLRKHIKDYVTLMVNPNYEDSNFEYYGPSKIDFLKSYIDEHKQEIDIPELKEYLNGFGIKIFNEEILNIEKQLTRGVPKTFEEDLELLFKEKVFTSYATDIYNVPEIAENRLANILKKYDQPIEKLIDNNLLARLANTTTTILIQSGETDEGYPYQSNYQIGINFLAFEIIKKFLKNTSEKIEDIKIGNNKPFGSSIVLERDQKLYVEDGNASNTVFKTFSKIMNLYRDFQYGESYNFSENYYSTALEVLNICLHQMVIEPKLIEELKPTLKETQKFIEENKGRNTYALKQINDQCLDICKTLGLPLESKTVSKSKLKK